VKFISTRGGAKEANFSEVLLAGLASDGGLYLPEFWPQLDIDEIAKFRGARYQDVAFKVISYFSEDCFDAEELRAAIEKAYADFDSPTVAPLIPVGNDLHILELFHGPTLAFKDIAMQILGQLFSRALAVRGGHVTIVAATSGDTGSAAIAALGGLPNINVFVMHPKDRISDIQRLQMTTSSYANVANVAITGTFDDAQSIVKDMFADTAFAKDIDLTAVNSINFVRIAAQCVYYFTAAVALSDPATFIVPTGNFGDIFAGEAAMRMGLPIRKLVAATNQNNIVSHAIETGSYKVGKVHHTNSPSMDIQVSSNFERALFESGGRNSKWLAKSMKEFSSTKNLDIPVDVLEELRTRYRGAETDDVETIEAIGQVYEESGRLIDPHTAVAFNAAKRMRSETEGPIVVLSTAHPAKFPEAVRLATGVEVPQPKQLVGLKDLPETLEILVPDLALIKQFISSRLAG
jgi:threonine synthase